MWLSQKGKTFSTEYFVIQWMKTRRPCCRLGITVSTRFGASVERNLYRRRAREAFRRSELRKMGGLDINLRAKNKMPPFQEFCAIFQHLLTACLGPEQVTRLP